MSNTHAIGVSLAQWLAQTRKVSNRLVRFTETPVRSWTYAIDPDHAAAAAQLINNARAEQEACFRVGLDSARIIRARGQGGAPLLCIVAPPRGKGYVVGSALRGQGVSVPVGLRLDLAPVGAPDAITTRLTAWVRFDQKTNPHLRIIGASGTGKTSTCLHIVRCLCAQNTPDELAVLVISDKRDDWYGLETLPHGYGLVGRDEAEAALTWVARKVERRLARGGVHRWLFVVFDDADDVVTAGVQEQIAIIARRGRSAGVAYLPNTQGPDAASIGGRHVRDSALDNITFAVQSGQAARAATGVGGSGANKTGRPGMGVLTIEGQTTPVILARGKPADLLAVPGGAPRVRPWRKVQVAGAGSGGSGWKRVEAAEADTAEARRAGILEDTPPASTASDLEAETLRAMLRDVDAYPNLKAIVAKWRGIESGGGNGYIRAMEELRQMLARLV